MIKFESEAHLEEELINGLYAKSVRAVLGIVTELDPLVQTQVKLGDYGVADIITVTDLGDRKIWQIVELKNRDIEYKDIIQIGRYRKALIDAGVPSGDVYCTLLGAGVADGDWGVLIEQLPWLKFKRFFLCVARGLRFFDARNQYTNPRSISLDDVVLQMKAPLYKEEADGDGK